MTYTVIIIDVQRVQILSFILFIIFQVFPQQYRKILFDFEGLTKNEIFFNTLTEDMMEKYLLAFLIILILFPNYIM